MEISIIINCVIYGFTLRVIFFNSVSSRTICNFLLISRERSSVRPSSQGLDPYTDAIIPPYLTTSACKTASKTHSWSKIEVFEGN